MPLPPPFLATTNHVPGGNCLLLARIPLLLIANPFLFLGCLLLLVGRFLPLFRKLHMRPLPHLEAAANSRKVCVYLSLFFGISTRYTSRRSKQPTSTTPHSLLPSSFHPQTGTPPYHHHQTPPTKTTMSFSTTSTLLLLLGLGLASSTGATLATPAAASSTGLQPSTLVGP